MQSFADFHLSRTYSVITVTCATIGLLIFGRPVALRTDIAQLELGSPCVNTEPQESAVVIYMTCFLVYGLVIFKLQAELLFEHNLCTPNFLNSQGFLKGTTPMLCEQQMVAKNLLVNLCGTHGQITNKAPILW